MWIQAGDEIRIVANVMKFMPEVGEVVDVRGHFFLHPSDFLQLRGSVKRDFFLCGFHFKAGVPGSPSRAVESAAKRIAVGKGGVHDMRQTEAGNQLDGGNPR